MKFVKIGFWILLAACTTKKIELPEEKAVTLQMATEGADTFEKYIRSLSVYAFLRTADGRYAYQSTLAELDSLGIASLQDVSSQGDTKMFKINLAVGEYELFFVGNAAGRLMGTLEQGVTLPEDIVLKGNPVGEEEPYFLGRIKARVVSDYSSPLAVTLSRAVGKLVLILTGVPSQLDSIRLSLGNIAQTVGIDGSLSSRAMSVERTYPLQSSGTNTKDTAIFEILTLPTIGGNSPFRLTFYTRLGQEKTKDMPPLIFLPDKYIRVTGKIDEEPGALLSFDITVYYLIFDRWEDKKLPDFSLNPPAQ